MKYTITTFLSLITFLCSYSQDFGNSCHDAKFYQNHGWYKFFLEEINKEYKIDSSDAKSIINTSSFYNPFVSGEKMIEHTVDQLGKLKESDIRFICEIVENGDTIIYALTNAKVYHHLFKYHPKTNILNRANNSGSIVATADEKVMLKENDNKTMLFHSVRKGENGDGWFRYYLFNKKDNTFTHTKNCRTINNKEKCKKIN